MDAIRLPIQPTGPQLSEHVAALDLLASRLDALASRQAWPARVPFNGKASFDGSIINTDAVKINIGPDEWMEMRPAEAADFVRRRKQALLEDHARMTEGQQPNSTQPVLPNRRVLKTREVRFSPVLRTKTDNPAPAPKEGEFVLQGPNGEMQEVPQSLQSLVDLVGEHLQDKLHLPGNETVNEEGLPIHEIRETPEGQLIGDEPIGEGEGEIAIPDDLDDFHRPEAAARREALKRRIFGELSDTESDEDSEDDSMDVEPASVATEPTPETAEEPGLAPRVTTPEPSHAQPAHRSPGNRPKSILKAPSRKKSVTFDSSVPLPPDSPPAREKLTFTPKPVPILNVPQPGKRTFGGLKSGFLQSANAAAAASAASAAANAGGNLAPSPSATKPNFASKGVVESTPPPVPSSSQPKIEEVGDDSMDVDDEEKPKKKSLFAQRRKQPEFPAIDSVKPMPTMKNSIVERAPLPPSVGEVPKDPASARAPLVVVDHDSDTDDYGDLGDFDDDEEDEYALDEALLQREAALALHRSLQRPREFDEDAFDPEAPDAAGNVYMAVPRVSTIEGGEGDAPLRIINPTADDLGQFLRVGRQEDGDLVFEPPTVHEDSDTDGEEAGQAAEDRRARRARRRGVMDQLLSGVYDDTPARDPTKAARDYAESLPPSVTSVAERAPAPASGATERASATGPVVERAPGPAAAGSVVEKAPPPAPPKVSASAGIVVERQPEPTAPAPPQPPKKVSRFKAARQGL